jgi:hypothetical protein
LEVNLGKKLLRPHLNNNNNDNNKTGYGGACLSSQLSGKITKRIAGQVGQDGGGAGRRKCKTVSQK